jgi:uncharacterized RDD family membrane protein YckC
MNGTFFCNKCGAQNVAGAQFCSRCGATTLPAAGVSPNVAPPITPPPATPSGAAYYPAASPLYPVVVSGAYGGFWIRVVAVIIDAIIVRVVVSPLHWIFGGLGLAGMMGGFHPRHLGILGGGVVLIATLFGSWLYEAFMESSSYQATLGKMILGMKVTDLNGNRISFERATGRHFAKWLSGMILGIGYIMVAFSDRKQGLHDLIAGTLVRRT